MRINQINSKVTDFVPLYLHFRLIERDFLILYVARRYFKLIFVMKRHSFASVRVLADSAEMLLNERKS